MFWLAFWLLLIVLIVAVWPAWPYSATWGYTTAGVLAAVLLVFLLLWLFGVIAITA